MFPSDQRKRFLAAADQIRNGSPLTDEQLEYLANVFEQIGHGSDANQVMGLTYSPGQRKVDEEALQERSFLFHWMRCAQVPAGLLDEQGCDVGGLGLTLEQTVNAVLDINDIGEWTNPVSGEKHIFKDAAGNIRSPFPKYTYDTLHAYWRTGKYKHMKELIASALTPNSPYPYEGRKASTEPASDASGDASKNFENNSQDKSI